MYMVYFYNCIVNLEYGLKIGIGLDHLGKKSIQSILFEAKLNLTLSMNTFRNKIN